jgi:hypothetical protein
VVKTNRPATLILKYAEQFEHDYDHDNYANYVEDVSVHTGEPYQRDGAMARIFGRCGTELPFPHIGLCTLPKIFSACSGRDSSLKRHYEIILGRPFDDEETNPKHQYSSIRLAPSQKGHKGRHNS